MIRIIRDSHPYHVEIDFPTAARNRTAVGNRIIKWLRANVADADWLGFEKCDMGARRIMNHSFQMYEIYFAHEQDAILLKTAFEGTV